MKNYILLIEDNEMLGSTLVDNFQMENYKIDWVRDGKEGFSVASRGLHDLIILDIMLPHMSGFDILRELRKSSQTPVLILSAKTQAEDRIHGLELRADDYLPKPFQFKELLLRCQNLLRRHFHPTHEIEKIIIIGKAEFNFKLLTVKSESHTESLSEKEFLLLTLLYTHKNEVISRERILDTIWGTNNYPSARTIDNFIVTLRKWIERDPSHPQIILSHRGIGYSLNLQNIESK